MYITDLEIKNFRNHTHTIVNFNNGLNVLCGDNAEGKTNTVESIYYSSLLISPRTRDVKELIKFGEEFAVIKMSISKEYRKHTITIQIKNTKEKKVLIDGIPVARAGELLGILGVVYFSPDELKIVKDTPNERRRFLDIAISQQQKNYYIALQKYNKILKNRNTLLKEQALNPNLDIELDVWDFSLAKEGATIISKRMEYIATLNDVASKLIHQLSDEKESMLLSYDSSLDSFTSNIEADLLNALKSSRQKDKELKYTTIGPHRDDLKIELNNVDSRKFASQGQQRTIALALKLGEIFIYRNETGEFPVLLLDDVLSELDDDRKKKLLDLTNEFQTILTCTKYDMPNKATIYHVKNGTVLKI